MKTLVVYSSLTGNTKKVAQAMAGNTKAAVFVRDSAGDKPADDVQVSTGMTDADRQLMANVAARLQQKDKNRQE